MCAARHPFWEERVVVSCGGFGLAPQDSLAATGCRPLRMWTEPLEFLLANAETAHVVSRDSSRSSFVNCSAQCVTLRSGKRNADSGEASQISGRSLKTLGRRASWFWESLAATRA